MKIEPLLHRCIIQEGNCVGNKFVIEINQYNIEDRCQHCKQPLATPHDLLLYIYGELIA